MKNNNVKIFVKYENNKFINFLVYNKIWYDNLCKSKEGYTLDIDLNDIDKFKRYDIEIIKYYGYKNIISFINTNKSILFGICVGLFIMFLMCNTIFDIKINSNNQQLVEKINKSLYENGISKYKRKISFNELQIIKNKILIDNKDVLEWIEIIEDGCIYIVELTERVKGNNINIDKSPSNIVASKDGLITHINLVNGVKVKDVNDYVKKGEVIITGQIYKDENLVSQTSAEGTVYAEVWYTTTVSIPFKYKEYIDTGKVINRYYIKLFDKEMTLIGKYNSENSISKKSIVLDKPYLPFDIYKEKIKIYKYKPFKVNEDEAYNEGLKRAEENIKIKLDSDEYIMDKKVLKKTVNSSKMILEVFFKVYENITSTSRIEEVNYDS